MIITIDTDILKQYNLSADEYVYLVGLGTNPDLLSNVVIARVSELVMAKGFLEIDDGFATITDKGKELLTTCSNITVENETAPLKATKLNTDLLVLAHKFRQLFPKGIRSGGYLVKSTKNSCLAKLKGFKRNYPEFSDEIIIKATHAYVSRKSREGYTHMKLAPYFIEKDGVSMLAAECEQFSEIEEEDDWGKDV